MTEDERCPWIGPITGTQCDKKLGHEGDHKPFPGINEVIREQGGDGPA